MSHLKSQELIKLDHPIDLRYKYKKGLFGQRKLVPTKVSEQRKLKKAFLKIFPDNLFIDDLFEKNSFLTEEQRKAQAKSQSRAIVEDTVPTPFVEITYEPDCDDGIGDAGDDE